MRVIGQTEKSDAKAKEKEAVLLKASKDGKYPVLCETLKEQIQGCNEGIAPPEPVRKVSLHGKVAYRNVMYLLDTCAAKQ